MLDRIFDLAIIGNQLFKDTALAAAGPVAWYRKRRAQIDLPEDLLERRPLIAKWWQGAASAPGGKVYYDMLPSPDDQRPRMPQNWADQLPEAVALASADYRRVVNYAGCPRNATLAQCVRMTHYLLDVCNFDGLILDAAATIPGPAPLILTDPDYYKVLGIQDECRKRRKSMGTEPVAFKGTFQSLLPVYCEDDPAGKQANLDWFMRQNATSRRRVMPEDTTQQCIAAQVTFDAEHCMKRIKQGWNVAVNFRQPEVQRWIKSLL